QNGGRESGPYVGASRCASRVSAPSAVQSPDRDPSKPRDTAAPAGTGRGFVVAVQSCSGRYEPSPCTSRLPETRSARGGSGSTSSDASASIVVGSTHGEAA